MSAEVKTLDTTCTLLLVDFPLNYFERYWQLAFIDDLRGPFTDCGSATFHSNLPSAVNCWAGKLPQPQYMSCRCWTDVRSLQLHLIFPVNHAQRHAATSEINGGDCHDLAEGASGEAQKPSSFVQHNLPVQRRLPGRCNRQPNQRSSRASR